MKKTKHQSDKLLAVVKPAAQIAPKSSLGVILNKLAKKYGTESPDSSGSGPINDSDQSQESAEIHHKSAQQNKTSINPIPPRKYNGSADPKAYHRFVLEGEAYLHDGKVSKEHRICLLAHYLNDKGYNFYMQKVAMDDPKEWDLLQTTDAYQNGKYLSTVQSICV